MPRLHVPRLEVFANREEAAAAAADRIARVIARPAVLGLATGRTLIPVYEQLTRRHAAGLSFAAATTFNLDEYWPIAPEHPGSFHAYMQRHLFDHVDLAACRRRLPGGLAEEAEIATACRDYERAIQEQGGIDLQLLGLGRNGHIGFNEPGSAHDSRTRRVELHQSTREDNARDFPGEAAPRYAITMGIGTILEARQILLLAFGSSKASALARLLAGPVSLELPASALLAHGQVTIFADPEAARNLAEPS